MSESDQPEVQPIFRLQQQQSIKLQTNNDYKFTNWVALSQICTIQAVVTFFFYFIEQYSYYQLQNTSALVLQKVSQIFSLFLTPKILFHSSDRKTMYLIVLAIFCAVLLIIVSSGIQDLQTSAGLVISQIYVYLSLIISGAAFGINQTDVYTYALNCRPHGQTNSGLMIGIIQAIEIITMRVVQTMMQDINLDKVVFIFSCLLILFVPAFICSARLQILYTGIEVDIDSIQTALNYTVPDSMELINGADELNGNETPLKEIKQSKQPYFDFLKIMYVRTLNGVNILLQATNASYFDVVQAIFCWLPESSINFYPDKTFLRYYKLFSILIEGPIYVIIGWLQDLYGKPKWFQLYLQVLILCVNFMISMTFSAISFSTEFYRVMSYIMISILQGMQYQSLHMIAYTYFKGNYRLVYAQIFIAQSLMFTIFQLLAGYILNNYFQLFMILVSIAVVTIKIFKILKFWKKQKK
ncbi:MFS_transporter superfamily [Hexamita inflata]|uniref:MFS transporter superfamily n=1 Tax=Hexamita inflata TaxID=28002 RepID=A0AA86U500_9EUKA|nr:MFS transporter superfamily [Hexamita inflata]